MCALCACVIICVSAFTHQHLTHCWHVGSTDKRDSKYNNSLLLSPFLSLSFSLPLTHSLFLCHLALTATPPVHSTELRFSAPLQLKILFQCCSFPFTVIEAHITYHSFSTCTVRSATLAGLFYWNQIWPTCWQLQAMLYNFLPLSYQARTGSITESVDQFIFLEFF